MKIPKTFIPKKLSEEKLEALLEKKKRKVKKGYSQSSKKYEYYCEVCGKSAGSIEVCFGYPKGVGFIVLWPDPDIWSDPDIDRSYKNKPRIVTKSFLGTTTLPKDREYLELIVEYIENEDLKSVLEKLNGDHLAFYCPTCDKCYCKAHWHTREVWDDWKGYDYTMGTCPEGHERMIDD